mgnify:CR=1 FL=1
MNLLPINDYVIVKIPPKKQKVSTGGIICGNTETREQSGVIVAIGPRVKDKELKIGNKIFFQLGDFKIVHTAPNEELAAVSEQHIVGVIEE